MTKRLIIAEDAFDDATWLDFETQDVLQTLAEHFAQFPQNARIYHEVVSEATDVTPIDEDGIEKLKELEGTFFVIVYPAEPITLIIIAVVLVAVIAATFLLKPTVPTATTRNTSSTSPNNDLSARTNKARPNARIPDIYGTVRSTPDLLCAPYSVFINNQEVENCYMCIGRGYYEVSDICDGDTPVGQIAGTTVEIYDPFTSPNSGDAPIQIIGTPIGLPLQSAIKSNSVNGQTLRAPNENHYVGNSDIFFAAPDTINTNNSNVDFTGIFQAGDSLIVANGSVNAGATLFEEQQAIFFTLPNILTFTAAPNAIYQVGNLITISNAVFALDPSITIVSGTGTATGTNSFVLDGTYVIEAIDPVNFTISVTNPVAVNGQWTYIQTVTDTKPLVLSTSQAGNSKDYSGEYIVLNVATNQITLSNPSSVNANWSTLVGSTAFSSPTLTVDGQIWIGPFVINDPIMNGFVANFVALNGLYEDDGTNQYRIDIFVTVGVQQLASDGVTPIGPEYTYNQVLTGSKTSTGTRAVTLQVNIPFVGICRVRALRDTPHNSAFKGNVIDEVKWRDFYSMSNVVQLDFGNVTTVHSLTYATSGALSVKERKLNMLTTRKLPTANDTFDGFTSTLIPTTNAADIICALALDPYNGNRTIAELDILNIYNTIFSIQNYFGSNLAAEFCYTFDSDNLSFEETISTIAGSVFCLAYRSASKLKLSFERQTDNSVILFNHRNKIPASETRTVTFGFQNDNDGLQFQYIDPFDDSVQTIYLPDQNAVNAKQITSVGIRNRLQAYFLASRIWSKIQNQHVSVEFTATQEAVLLLLQDRILVADNTRPHTQDGEVVAQNGLVLTLSQKVDLTQYSNYSVFLQMQDESVQSIEINAGATPYQIVLGQAPRLPLCIDPALFARTTYAIVGNEQVNNTPFLVSERSPKTGMLVDVKAANYDDRFYSEDNAFIEGRVDINGFPI